MEKYCPKCFKKFSGGETRCPECAKKLIAMQERDLVGQELDERYNVLSLLGRGGMGVVYVAEQAMVGRKVALKVLRRDMVQDESTVKRFFTEGKAIASLRSRHTVTLHDFGVTDDGLLYYTMELLEGLPLSNLIAQQGPLPYERAADIIFQALESLEEAHDTGILHRDIKPENLFISQRRENDHVTVLDFGIAKLLDDSSIETVTKTGMICGTPAYLAPEQALGNPAVPASDLYSLGIVLYEMLAGTPPFHETTPLKLLLLHLNERPEPVHISNPNVQIPASLDAFLQKALEKQPENRFASVLAFRKALEAALDVHRRHPETAPLAPIASTAQGLRAIPEREELPAWERSPEGEAETVVQRVARTEGSDPEGAQSHKSHQPAGGDGKPALVPVPDRSNRKWVWGLVGLVATCLVLLAFWQPWVTEDGATDRTDLELSEAGSSEASAAPDGEKTTAGEEAGPPAQDRGEMDSAAAAQMAQLKAEAEAAKKEADEARRQRAQAENRADAEQEARLKSEEAARRKAEEEAKARAEEEAKAKAKEEAKAKAEEEAKAKAEEEAKAKAEEEARRKAEKEARRKAEKEARREAEEEARRKAEAAKKEAERKAREKAEKARGTKTQETGGGFGFRPVDVDKKDPAGSHGVDEKEEGFGFRPVEVPE